MTTSDTTASEPSSFRRAIARWLPLTAIAFTIALATAGVYGQSSVSAAPIAGASHAVSVTRQGALSKHHRLRRAHVRHGFEGWRRWCKHDAKCVKRFSWTARGNPAVRHARWRSWCLARPVCLREHSWLRPIYVLTGPVGTEISRLPEGAYVATFMQAARAYGVSPEIMMGIGMVESGGGTAGTAYEGCMNGATFGSWPGQIYCAAGVLSRVGLAGYNAVNPSYSYTVMGEADGIGIITR